MEAAKSPPQKKRATFFDIIHMIRIKKMLNRKLTTSKATVDNATRIASIQEVPEIPEVTTNSRLKVESVRNLWQMPEWSPPSRPKLKRYMFTDVEKPGKGSR